MSEVCWSNKISFFSLLIFLPKSKAVFVKGVCGIEPKGKNPISTSLLMINIWTFKYNGWLLISI